MRLSVAKTGTGFAVTELSEKAARATSQSKGRDAKSPTARPNDRGAHEREELLDGQRCSTDGIERTEGDALQTQCGRSTAPVQGRPGAEPNVSEGATDGHRIAYRGQRVARCDRLPLLLARCRPEEPRCAISISIGLSARSGPSCWITPPSAGYLFQYLTHVCRSEMNDAPLVGHCADSIALRNLTS